MLKKFPKNISGKTKCLTKKKSFLRNDVSIKEAIFCYTLPLFIIIHLNMYKVFWQNAKIPSKEREHLFIYSSFIYDKWPINTTYSASSNGKIHLIILYLAEQSHNSMDQMECIVTKNAVVKKMTMKKEYIKSLGICALELYLLTCTVDWMSMNGSNLSAADEQPDVTNSPSMYSLIMRDQSAGGARPKKQKLHRQQIAIIPNRPSYTKRGLVLCMSRVFLLEKWQLLITALEAYRLFKVDLVVARIQSALFAVFELLKVYETLGFLKIQHGIRFPHHRGMKWDPNAETEFNGQILLAHECFYEYRESAQFIGLIDWDDLLVPSKHFPDLFSAFSAAFAKNPDTAYFLVNKIEASFVEQKVKFAREFSIRKMFESGIRTAPMYNDEKMVVRPKALRGFWMHNSFNMGPMKRIVKLFSNYSIILHLANDERLHPDEFQVPFMTKFNISEMDQHASRQLAKMEELKLPSSQPFYYALLTCHNQIFAYYRRVGQHKSVCLSYSLCRLPQLPEAICVVTQSKFGTFFTGNAAINVRKESHFRRVKCSERNEI